MKIVKETASMELRDGVRLDADIYRPDRDEKFPVLLMRQPYGRAIASTVVYAHPRWYASQGYIVAIQDVRGRGTSEGKFHLLSREIEDGFDSVAWAAQLPGSTGKVGMYGFSYQGMTQLYAAGARPPALKVLCPGMVGYNLYSDWAYENGAFCLQGNLGWAVQLAAETARLRGDEPAFNTLYAASRNLPLYDPSPHFGESLRKYGPDNFYNEWLKHPHFDEYWRQLSPNLEGIDLPMLHIGGWFDPYLRGTLNLYQNMVKGQSPQLLIIGPWAHLPWGRTVGAMDYGPAAQSPVDVLQIRWFDRFLKGVDTGILNEPPVRLFEMGSNQWRYCDRFPSPPTRSYALVTNGLASVREDGGQLVSQSSLSRGDDREDILIRDPWRPVPSLGGHAAIPAGSFDRSALDGRTDVLTYTSEPLAEALHILGEGWVELYCTADAPSFDLCAVLSEVRASGGAYNFTQGYIRVNPSETGSNCLKIPLQATGMSLAKGDRLRLSISADCFPAYSLNLGTGALPGEGGAIEARIITITLKCGEGFPSRICLPVVEGDRRFP